MEQSATQILASMAVGQLPGLGQSPGGLGSDAVVLVLDSPFPCLGLRFPSWTCIVRRCGKSKIAKPVQQFAQVRSRVPQRLHGIERIHKAVPAGGRRHELCNTCGSLRADSQRIEATFLPDDAGKELYRKLVLRRRLF